MAKYNSDQPQIDYIYTKFGKEYITPSWEIANYESSIDEAPVYQISNGKKTMIKVYNTNKI